MGNEPDRNIRAHARATSEKQAAKARQTERMIERLSVVDEPRKEWDLRLDFAVAPRAGAIVAVLQRATVQRGTFGLGPVDLQIDWATGLPSPVPTAAARPLCCAPYSGRWR